jgi:hypothetical protein
VKVRCCAPHIYYDNVTYICTECGGNNTEGWGWAHGPRGRWVLDIEEPYLLCSYTYRCNDCEKVNMCSDPRALAALGYDRAQAHDFVPSHRTGMSRRLLTSLSSSITGGMSFSSYTALLQSVWREAYDSKKCTYVGHCTRFAAALDMRETSINGLFGGIQVARRPTRTSLPFPDYTARGINGYNGQVPSRNLLRGFFVRHVRFAHRGPTSYSLSYYYHYYEIGTRPSRHAGD